MSEIIIDKNAKQITFTNNGIGFSQFGVANEILDLIENQTKEIERLHSIIKEVREKVNGIKEVNNEVYKQTDMLERFYSRKWCNDKMDNFLEILDKENK